MDCIIVVMSIINVQTSIEIDETYYHQIFLFLFFEGLVLIYH